MRAALSLLLAAVLAPAWAQSTAGTPVRLMLLKELSSASSKLGETVPFVVMEDIVVDGQVVVAEGTMAFAKITQKRREGALSAPVWDRPARLFLRFQHIRDGNGRAVELWPKPDKAGELQIFRETGYRPTAAETKIYQLTLGNSTTRPIMEKVRNLFHSEAAVLTRREAEILIEHNVAIPGVQEAIRRGYFVPALNLISDLRRGRFEALLGLSPTTRPALVAIRAVRDLGRLSGGLTRYLEGRFKGRNIHCATGTELTVYLGA